MKMLITAPPMLGMLGSFTACFEDLGFQITAPAVVQTLSEADLKQLVPLHAGWIV